MNEHGRSKSGARLCLFVILVALSLSACGRGGGGEATPSPAVLQEADSVAHQETGVVPAQGTLSALSSVALRNCGNENEAACGLAETDFWNGACDTGLRRKIQVCGCLLRGPFGGCLIPQFCAVCVNDTRRRPSLNVFSGSWADWALRNQRDSLAKDEPLNWVTHLGTHNSFNSHSDGHRPIPGDLVGNVVDAPNHFYSMTDQLRAGSRVLAIDLHYVDNHARLCHGGLQTIDIFGGINLQLCVAPQILPPFFPGMRYYANGIKEIRNWLRDNPNEVVIIALENYVGGGCRGCRGDALFGTAPLDAYLGDWIYSVSEEGAPQDEHGFWPSRRDLLARGERVIVLDAPLRDPLLEFDLGAMVSGGFGTWYANRQDYYPVCKGTTADDEGGPKAASNGQFSVVVEDRTLLAPITQVGFLDADAVAAAAQCNYGIIFMDFFSSLLPVGRVADLPDFSRQKAAVWSWKENDRGQNGDCAKLDASSGRWVSAGCNEEHRFACAPPRSESGTDSSQWRPLEDDWKVTVGAGQWADGQATCASEYPGHVFSVPVNGFQNTVLRGAQGAAGDLWLNYTDQRKEGVWEIPKLENINTPPVADAGPDQEIECGSTVTLDGSGSTDADGDPLAYTWTGPFGTLTGLTVSATLGAGTHAITLAVDDGKGGTDTDAVTITVSDTTPPAMTLSLSPTELWPPDHEPVKVTAEVRTEDSCAGELALVELVSIVSNEPENDQGDGNTAPDIQDADIGTGDLEFLLRAERSASGSGRVYSVTYQVSDLAGNTTMQSAEVTVPHDRRGAVSLP